MSDTLLWMAHELVRFRDTAGCLVESKFVPLPDLWKQPHIESELWFSGGRWVFCSRMCPRSTVGSGGGAWHQCVVL